MSHSRTLEMPPHCDLRSIRSLQGALLAAFDGDSAVTLDCGGVERADVAFIQLILAAGQTAQRRGATLMLANRTACLDASFERAGLDPSAPFKPAH